jgi:hypothetical protein
MEGTAILTGTTGRYLIMTCLLERSLKHWAEDLELFVLDFGLDERQRRFFKNRGALLDRPNRMKRGLHPYYYKGAMAEFLGKTWSSLMWVDSDMIAVAPLRDALIELLREMEKSGYEVAACKDDDLSTIGRLASGVPPGCSAAPFIERIRAEEISLDAPYYNVGLVVCRSHEFMRAWSMQTERFPAHYLFEQNAFNLVAQRRRKLLDLPNTKWNFHGRLYTESEISYEGGAVTADGHPVFIVHPISGNPHHIERYPNIRVGCQLIPCEFRLCQNMVLRQIQITMLKDFLADNWDHLCEAVTVQDSDHVGGVDFKATSPVSPTVGRLISEALELHLGGHWNLAEERLEQIEAIDSKHPISLCHRAWRALQKDQASKAIRFSEQSLQGDPQNARAHLIAGIASIQLGAMQNALASFNKAAAIAPDMAEIHLQRAHAYELIGNFELALAASSESIKIASNRFGGWYRRASVLTRLGRTVEAKTARDHAVSLVGP